MRKLPAHPMTGSPLAPAGKTFPSTGHALNAVRAKKILRWLHFKIAQFSRFFVLKILTLQIALSPVGLQSLMGSKQDRQQAS